MGVTTQNTPNNGLIRKGSNANSLLASISSGGGGTVDASALISGQHGAGVQGTDYVIYQNSGLSTISSTSRDLTPVTFAIPSGWGAARVQIYFKTDNPDTANTVNNMELFGNGCLVASMIAMPDYTDSVNMWAGYSAMYAYNGGSSPNYTIVPWYTVLGKTYTQLAATANGNGYMTPSYTVSNKRYSLQGLGYDAYIEYCKLNADNVELGFRTSFENISNPNNPTNYYLVVISKVPV